MKKLAVLLLQLSIITLVFSVLGCGSVSDAERVNEVILQSVKATNDSDWHALYQLQSPNYRAACTYEEFEEYNEEGQSQVIAIAGSGQFDVSDINVIVEGEWAYATYDIYYDNEFIGSYTSDDPDIFRRVNGKWYDVQESPTEPGYNPEDLP